MLNEKKITEKILKESPYNKNFLKEPSHKKINALIIGAGMGGRLVLRELMKKNQHNIVGFVDDDKELIGDKIREIPIYGPISEIDKILIQLKKQKREIEEVVIAMPSAEGTIIKKIMNSLFQKVSKILILPTAYEDPYSMKTGLVVPEKIREVRIEDFFRRKPMILPFEEIFSHYKDKKILITGAGGSIGSEIVKQLISFSPEHLILLENSELALFNLQGQLSNHDSIKKTFLLSDLRNKKKIKAIVSHFQPDIIFHAAAYKHVPLLEDNPEESVTNNIAGFCNLLQSINDNVKEFVLISTDKAVNPLSIMGISKRICEFILQSKSKTSSSNFFAVRFGNVAGSSGSVIPLFEKQIDKGGPITVTDSKMTRFFMTIPEAAQLVLQTPIVGKSRNIFVLDMGEQYSILELAKDMIMLRGFVPNEDIQIKIIGERGAEKMEEELIGKAEELQKTRNSRIFTIRTNQVDEKKLMSFLSRIFKISEGFDREEINKQIKKEFRDFESHIY